MVKASLMGQDIWQAALLVIYAASGISDNILIRYYFVISTNTTLFIPQNMNTVN
jgi:hypothetical protein